jgi:hypothetical protein
VDTLTLTLTLTQGILLGLTVDTALWAAYDALADLFTRKMNYRTVGRKETALVRARQY